MNKRNCDSHAWDCDKKYQWIHDINGQEMNFWSDIEGTYPECSMMWVDGELGGSEFRTLNNLTFKSTIGARGIGYIGVIAFDENGNGKIFLKD